MADEADEPVPPSLEDLRRFWRSNQGDTLAALKLGSALADQRHFDEAIEVLAPLSDQLAEASYWHGYSLAGLKRYRAALDRLDQARTLPDASARVRREAAYLRGRIFEQAGRAADAVLDYDRAAAEEQGPGDSNGPTT